LHWIWSKAGSPGPRRAWGFRAFHRRLPLFANQMREMKRKYKILWFVVDIHNRERYFFICGCKRIVTNSGLMSLRQSAQRRELAVF
jgi:hypothetical protein